MNNDLSAVAICDTAGVTTTVAGQPLQGLRKRLAADDHVIIPFTALLSLHGLHTHGAQTIECLGSNGETISFPFADVLSNRIPLALQSTNHGDWKLIQKTPRQDATDQGHYFLRSVAAIRLFKEPRVQREPQTSVVHSLAAALQQPDDVAILNLSGQHLHAFPNEVIQLPHLQELNLGRNQIAELPPEIKALRQLKALLLGRNQLNTLPPEIGFCQNLQILKCGRNQLVSLPKEVGQLKQLTWLDVCHNQLTHLPEAIGELEQLRELGMESNRVAQVPDAILQLKHLEVWELTGNPVALSEVERLRTRMPNTDIQFECR